MHWSIAKRSVTLTREYEQKSLLAEEEQESQAAGDFLGELPKSFKLSRQGFYPLMPNSAASPGCVVGKFSYSYNQGLFNDRLSIRMPSKILSAFL